ncbi:MULTISPECIES: hypothetical protein [Ramlibacter]|uniref:GGDEF domain-containing protein n=1 Tax=Ramlibacter aquaticus TaxID=2780094 RepID=A0ABR9SJ60_9BURK|nr:MULTISPECIES: hypothetical protein [Ramlibacter]MBE7941792.1 hypothetical protein [Ramlibacter aquaticus]
MSTLLDTCLFLSEGNGLIDDCRGRRVPVAVVVLEAALPLDLEDSDPVLHAALQACMDGHLGAIAAQPGLAACLGAGTFALLLPRVSPRQALQLVGLELGTGLQVTVPDAAGGPGRPVVFSAVARPLPGAENGLEQALLRLLEDAESRLEAMAFSLPPLPVPA